MMYERKNPVRGGLDRAACAGLDRAPSEARPGLAWGAGRPCSEARLGSPALHTDTDSLCCKPVRDLEERVLLTQTGRAVRLGLTAILSLSLAGAVSGCASLQGRSKPGAEVEGRALDGDLENAAQQVASAWKSWGAVYSAAHPSAVVAEDQGPPPRELDQRVQVNWSGPLEPLIRGLLARTGYRLVVRGLAPPMPVLVSLAGSYQLFDAIKEAGYQAGPRVQVVINERERVVVVAYQSGQGLNTETKGDGTE